MTTDDHIQIDRQNMLQLNVRAMLLNSSDEI